jgi:hypothetical protein
LRRLTDSGSRLAARLALAAPFALAAAALLTTPASATIDGPCQGHGYETPGKPNSVADAKTAGGGTVDFHSAVWHVKSWKDWLSGDGSADGAMSSGVAYVDAFGQTITVAQGTGSGATGQGGPISPYDLAQHLPGPLGTQPPAAVIFASGNAQVDPKGNPPASGPCSGEIAIVFDDASPASTTEGQFGIAMMVLGGAGLAGTAFRR